MSGEVFAAHGYTLKYDIENIKKFPDAIPDGEMVLITEKLHGTWTCFGFHPDIGHPIVTSKGLSGQGLAFKINEQNADNLYIRSLINTADADGNDAIDRLQKEFVAGLPFFIIGETYGKGVQDLHYGMTKPHFRAFDIYVGECNTGAGRYLNGHEFMAACHKIGLEMVPVLYHGPYSKALVKEFTDGKDTVTGAHMREGVVVRGLLDDKRLPDLGRVILKSVSEAYLLRKGDATEYN
jgi:RNA ligase (TIGR02306 family)